eukprot:6955442-Lingulodinium_polyedra.AAC.1
MMSNKRKGATKVQLFWSMPKRCSGRGLDFLQGGQLHPHDPSKTSTMDPLSLKTALPYYTW